MHLYLVCEERYCNLKLTNFSEKRPKYRAPTVCGNFLVTSKLNGMESILGAEFLFGKDEIAGISKNSIMFEIDNVKTTATIWSELDCRDKV